MNVRYRVELDQCERDQLTALLSGGKRGARKLKRAQILLAVDRGASRRETTRGLHERAASSVPSRLPEASR